MRTSLMIHAAEEQRNDHCRPDTDIQIEDKISVRRGLPMSPSTSPHRRGQLEDIAERVDVVLQRGGLHRLLHRAPRLLHLLANHGVLRTDYTSAIPHTQTNQSHRLAVTGLDCRVDVDMEGRVDELNHDIPVLLDLLPAHRSVLLHERHRLDVRFRRADLLPQVRHMQNDEVHATNQRKMLRLPLLSVQEHFHHKGVNIVKDDVIQLPEEIGGGDRGLALVLQFLHTLLEESDVLGAASGFLPMKRFPRFYSIRGSHRLRDFLILLLQVL